MSRLDLHQGFIILLYFRPFFKGEFYLFSKCFRPLPGLTVPEDRALLQKYRFHKGNPFSFLKSCRGELTFPEKNDTMSPNVYHKGVYAEDETIRA